MSLPSTPAPRSSPRMFSIPMRGNETTAMDGYALGRQRFSIPMRGNEWFGAAFRFLHDEVFDPHEG